jgi:hypothetical protein
MAMLKESTGTFLAWMFAGLTLFSFAVIVYFLIQGKYVVCIWAWVLLCLSYLGWRITEGFLRDNQS